MHHDQMPTVANDDYAQGFDAAAEVDAAEFRLLDAEIARLRAALTEISKGEGAFSRDPLTHAVNTIDSMKQIARDALSPEQPATTG
jgi:hypothetical protein